MLKYESGDSLVIAPRALGRQMAPEIRDQDVFSGLQGSRVSSTPVAATYPTSS
jgi:hypothetical protein